MATKQIPLKAATVFHSVFAPSQTRTLPPGTQVLYSQFDGDHRASLHVATYRDGDDVWQCYRLADPLPAADPQPAPYVNSAGEEGSPADDAGLVLATMPRQLDDRELVLYRSKAGKLARYVVVERFTDTYSYGRLKGRPCACVRLKPADWVGEVFTLVAPSLTPCPAGVVTLPEDEPQADGLPETADVPTHRGRPTQTAWASDLGFAPGHWPMTADLQLETMREPGRFVHAQTLFDAAGEEVVGAVYEGPGFDLTVYND